MKKPNWYALGNVRVGFKTSLVKVLLPQERCCGSGIQWTWDASENLVVACYRQIQLHSSSHIKTMFLKWLWEAAIRCKSIRNKVCQWGQSAVRLPIHSQRNCLLNIGAPQYIRQTLTDIRGEIDSNTIIVGDTPLTPMDRSSKQKINK